MYKIRKEDIRMARGAKAKEEVIAKILETFSGSFKNDKEIRIPIQEDGETIQIKVALTAAKVNVSPDGEDTVFMNNTPTTPAELVESPMIEPTAEEKKNVEEIIRNLF